MSKVVRRRWQSDLDRTLPRKDPASCEDGAYIPDHLVGRPIRMDGDVAADVADAAREIAPFNAKASALLDTEALARLLLRAEAVASSKIEGLEVGGRRLLRAERTTARIALLSDVAPPEVLGRR